jgi:hypothetical protein
MRCNAMQSRRAVHVLCCVVVVLLLCVCAYLGKAEHTSTEMNECLPSPAVERREEERRGGTKETTKRITEKETTKRETETNNRGETKKKNRKEKVKQYQGNRRSVTSSPTLRSALPSERRVEECRKVFREGLHRGSSSRTSVWVLREGLQRGSSQKVFTEGLHREHRQGSS